MATEFPGITGKVPYSTLVNGIYTKKLYSRCMILLTSGQIIARAAFVFIQEACHARTAYLGR